MLNLFCPDRDGPDCGPTVQGVIDAYLIHLRVRVGNGDYSAAAYPDCARVLSRFARAFGRLAVDRCKRHDLSEFLASQPRWKSGHTKRRAVRYLCACFAWAHEEDLIPQNPYRGYRLNALAEPRRPMTAPEYCALMRHGSRALRRALLFLRRTGCRTCEMRALTWGQIQWDLGVIVQAKHKTSKRTGKPRVIGLDGSTLRLLRNLGAKAAAHAERAASRPVVDVAGMAADATVFGNCDGLPWTASSFSLNVRRCAKRAGLGKGVCAYGLRHLWTLNGVASGLSDRQLADQLGHTSTRMVSWYAARSRESAAHLRRVANEASAKRPRNGQS